MDIKRFRELDAETKVRLVNERLEQIRAVKEFKSNELEFTYSTAAEELERLGYERKGNGFIKTLSAADITVLLELAKNYDALMSSRYSLGAKVVESSNVKATTLKVDIEILERWQAYCRKHSDFSAPSLLGAALTFFMDIYE